MNTYRRKLNNCLTLGALTLTSTLASARVGDLATKWPVNDEDPSASIPDTEARNKDPLEFGYFLQDLIARAEGAFTEKDYQAAIRYYEALGKAVPDKAITFRRLCTAYERVGNLRKAEGNCWALLKRKGVVVDDHLRLMRLSLSQISEGAPAVVEERTRMIDASADHVRQHLSETPKEDLAKLSPKERGDLQPPSDSAEVELPLELQVELVACRLAAHLRDIMRLQQCVDALHSIKADAKLAIPFQWSHAVARGDQTRIDQVLADAKQLGMPAEAIKAMAEGPKTLPPRPEPKLAGDGAAAGVFDPSNPSDKGGPSEQAGTAAAALPSDSLRAGFDLEAWFATLAAALGLAGAGWLVWQKSSAVRHGERV